MIRPHLGLLSAVGRDPPPVYADRVERWRHAMTCGRSLVAEMMGDYTYITADPVNFAVTARAAPGITLVEATISATARIEIAYTVK